MTRLLFSSPTCAPCKAIKPVVERDHPEVAIIDILRQKQLADEHGITSVPVLIDGEARVLGARDILAYLRS